MFEQLPITSRQAYYLCPRFYLSYLAGLCVLTIWQCPLLSEAGLSSWAVSGRPWITAEPGGWGSFRASLLQALSTLCLCQFNSPNCCLGAGGGNWVIKSLLLLCQSGGSAILAQYWCRRELYTESDWQVQLKPLVSNFRCSMLHPSQAEKALLHNCMCISGPWRQRAFSFYLCSTPVEVCLPSLQGWIHGVLPESYARGSALPFSFICWRTPQPGSVIAEVMT